MTSSRRLNWTSLAGVLAGLLGLVLTPVTAAAGYNWWGVTYRGWDDNVPPISKALRFMVEPMLGLAPRNEVYPTYGRSLIFVFLLMLMAAVGLWGAFSGHLDSRGKRGMRLILIGLVMQVLGNVGDYWLGERVLRQPLWGITFVVGSQIGFLVYGVGSMLLGRSLLRMKALPNWSAWGLIISPPMGILLLFFWVYHMPSSWVLPISLAWLLVGLGALVRLRTASAQNLEAPG